jgi:hypothetical protein
VYSKLASNHFIYLIVYVESESEERERGGRERGVWREGGRERGIEREIHRGG